MILFLHSKLGTCSKLCLRLHELPSIAQNFHSIGKKEWWLEAWLMLTGCHVQLWCSTTVGSSVGSMVQRTSNTEVNMLLYSNHTALIIKKFTCCLSRRIPFTLKKKRAIVAVP